MGVKVVCKQCGKEFKVIPYRVDKAKFCSRDCYIKHRYGKNNPDWKGGLVKIICKQCGEEKEVRPSHADRKFCSQKCCGAWKSENLIGENSPLWRTKLKKVCEVCGKGFKIHPCRADTAKYCSRKCRDIWRSENQRGENHPNWKGGKVEIACNQCGKEFEVKPSRVGTAKCCSLDCHYKHMRGENNSRWKAKIKKVCKWCGEGFERVPSYATIKFCSATCMGLWYSENRVGENHPGWKGGNSCEPYSQGWTDSLRERIRKRDDHTCAISGEVWQPGQHRFPVHHIDYNKKNHMPENLITLELSCHAKTNTNRNLWQSLLEPIAQAREETYACTTE